VLGGATVGFQSFGIRSPNPQVAHKGGIQESVRLALEEESKRLESVLDERFSKLQELIGASRGTVDAHAKMAQDAAQEAKAAASSLPAEFQRHSGAMIQRATDAMSAAKEAVDAANAAKDAARDAAARAAVAARDAAQATACAAAAAIAPAAPVASTAAAGVESFRFPANPAAGVADDDDALGVPEAVQTRLDGIDRVLAKIPLLEARFNHIDDHIARALAPLLGEIDSLKAQLRAAETARIAAEDARALAIRGQSDAEAARAAAETNIRHFSASEAVRVAAEDARARVEAQRVCAEHARSAAEASRAVSEKALLDSVATAEAVRVAAEDTRARADVERVSAEHARSTAEASRAVSGKALLDSVATAEAARVAAEDTRARADVERVSAEHARSTAEAARALAGVSRTKKGTAHATSENTRLVAIEWATVPENAVDVKSSEKEAGAKNATVNGEEGNAVAQLLSAAPAQPSLNPAVSQSHSAKAVHIYAAPNADSDTVDTHAPMAKNVLVQSGAEPPCALPGEAAIARHNSVDVNASLGIEAGPLKIHVVAHGQASVAAAAHSAPALGAFAATAAGALNDMIPKVADSPNGGPLRLFSNIPQISEALRAPAPVSPKVPTQPQFGQPSGPPSLLHAPLINLPNGTASNLSSFSGSAPVPPALSSSGGASTSSGGTPFIHSANKGQGSNGGALAVAADVCPILIETVTAFYEEVFPGDLEKRKTGVAGVQKRAGVPGFDPKALFQTLRAKYEDWEKYEAKYYESKEAAARGGVTSVAFSAALESSFSASAGGVMLPNTFTAEAAANFSFSALTSSSPWTAASSPKSTSFPRKWPDSLPQSTSRVIVEELDTVHAVTADARNSMPSSPPPAVHRTSGTTMNFGLPNAVSTPAAPPQNAWKSPVSRGGVEVPTAAPLDQPRTGVPSSIPFGAFPGSHGGSQWSPLGGIFFSAVGAGSSQVPNGNVPSETSRFAAFPTAAVAPFTQVPSTDGAPSKNGGFNLGGGTATKGKKK
jgi:hypothetical protein